MAEPKIEEKPLDTPVKSSGAQFYRFAEVQEGSENDADHTLQIVFSSEYPVEKMASAWDEANGVAKRGEKYLEVLSHEESDADFTELNKGGALLDEHDGKLQIGQVKHAEISKDRKARAAIYYDFITDLSRTRYDQAKKKVRRYYSVGGEKTKYLGEQVLKSGAKIKRFAWNAFEISSTYLPADPNSEIARSAEMSSMKFHCTKCACELERGKLDENYRCETCGPVTRSAEEKVDSQKLVTAEPELNIQRTKFMADEPKAPTKAEIEKEVTAVLEPQLRTKITGEVEKTTRSAAKTDFLARNKKITDKTDTFIKEHGMKQRGKLGETLRAKANEFLSKDHGDSTDAHVMADFGQACLEEIAKVQPEPYLLRSLASEKEYNGFSMMNGIKSIITRSESGKGHSRLPDKSFELDVHEDMLARGKENGGLLGSSSDAGGWHIPMDAPTPNIRASLSRSGKIQRSAAVGNRFRRDLYTGDFGSGGALVPTEMITPIIEPLRNWTALSMVGCRFMGGLSGNVVMPRQTGVVAPQAVSEIGALVATQPDFDQISARPRRVGNQTKYSKQLLFQADPSVEAIVRDDNFKQIALQVDEYGINGSGGNNQPLGIMNQPGVFSKAFGGTATIASIEAFATAIRASNIRGPLEFLATSNVRGRWRSIAAALVNATTVISGQQNAIWTGSDEEGLVTGRPAHDSQQIPNDQVILGMWDDFIWFQWAGVEIVVDPYTVAGTGEWLITMNTYNDFAVRHPQAFCISADAGTQ